MASPALDGKPGAAESTRHLINAADFSVTALAGQGHKAASGTFARCIATPAVRKHIREHETHLIHSEIQTGRKHGMQTMDNALLELYQRADITYDVCLSNARDQEFMRARASGKPLER
jgi:Tfp pilus assembly pilus retraction ATPase PilT